MNEQKFELVKIITKELVRDMYSFSNEENIDQFVDVVVKTVNKTWEGIRGDEE